MTLRENPGLFEGYLLRLTNLNVNAHVQPSSPANSNDSLASCRTHSPESGTPLRGYGWVPASRISLPSLCATAG
jgi:hypothetical protein